MNAIFTSFWLPTTRHLLAAKMDLKTLVSRTELFVFDCDGVIWHGDHIIPGMIACLSRVSAMMTAGAKNALETLKAANKKLSFVTNNSTKTRKAFSNKFKRLGIPWVEENDIWTSAYAAAAFLRDETKLPSSKKVYVVGEQGLVDELESVGYSCLGGPADAHKVFDGDVLHVDENIGAVVVGFDGYINYYKLSYATIAARTLPGCVFLATNRDSLTHLNPTQEFPGGGTMVAALETAIGTKPLVAGKPSPFLMTAVEGSHGINAGSGVNCCMIGDRIDTDVLFGKANDIDTILVLTGVTSKAMAANLTEKESPTLVTESIADLAACF